MKKEQRSKIKILLNFQRPNITVAPRIRINYITIVIRTKSCQQPVITKFLTAHAYKVKIFLDSLDMHI